MRHEKHPLLNPRGHRATSPRSRARWPYRRARSRVC